MTVELPKDAEGREIPLDTEMLYDKEGERREVDWYTFYPDKDRWDVVFEDSCVRFSPHNLSITPQDRWEKLEEDARKTACAYAPAPLNEDGLVTCDGCPFEKSESCSNEMTIDLVERAKKLAGIEEEARND